MELIWEAAADGVVSLIVLGSALGVEALKRLFGPEGPPAIVALILFVSEITLLITFIVRLLRAVGRLAVALGLSRVSAPPARPHKMMMSAFADAVQGLRDTLLLGFICGVLIMLFVAAAALIHNPIVIGTCAVLLVAFCLASIGAILWSAEQDRKLAAVADSGIATVIVVGVVILACGLAIVTLFVIAVLVGVLLGNESLADAFHSVSRRWL